MWSRTVSIVIASWLPCLVALLPFGRVHAANALIAGTAATILSAFAMGGDGRIRAVVCALGAWVAFTPLVVHGTLLEMVVEICWGVSMFVFIFMGGPFSAPHEVTRVRAAVVVLTPMPLEAPPQRAAA
jgi:hypothetical protein